MIFTELQKYLLSGKTLADLAQEYGIINRRHQQYPNLILFKYDQRDSPFGEQIVRESRGIILDENQNWKIINRIFDKFFNYGEGHAAVIDWTTARVQNKLDGSLCQLYYYDHQWRIASSGSPDASGQVQDFKFTFQDYFWRTWEQYQQIFDTLPKHWSVALELMGSYNRVVVQHTHSKLAIIGGRDLLTQQELTPQQIQVYLPNIPIVEEFPLTSIDQIISSFEYISPTSQEGYVVVDANFNRLKIKHPGYIALHHLKDGLNLKSLLEIVRRGETDEVLSVFPEFSNQISQLQTALNQLNIEVAADYTRLQHINSQKEFALEAIKSRCSSALFMMRAKKVADIKTFFREMRIENLLDLLSIK